MAQAIDVVCGMTVDTETAEHTSEYQGTKYYFCAPGCKRAFDKSPTEFLDNGQSATGSESQDHGTHS